MNEQKKKVSLWILGILTIILVAVIVVLIVFLISKNQNEKKLMDQVKALSNEKAELETKTESVNEKIKNIQGQLNEIAGEKNNETVEENAQEDSDVLQSFSGDIAKGLKTIKADIKAIKKGEDDKGRAIIKYDVTIEGNKVAGIEDEHVRIVDNWKSPYFETDLMLDKNEKDWYVVLIIDKYQQKETDGWSTKNAYIIDTKGNIVKDNFINRSEKGCFDINSTERDKDLHHHTFLELGTRGMDIQVIDNQYLYDAYQNSDRELEVHEYSIENGKFNDKVIKTYSFDEYYGIGSY